MSLFIFTHLLQPKPRKAKIRLSSFADFVFILAVGLSFCCVQQANAYDWVKNPGKIIGGVTTTPEGTTTGSPFSVADNNFPVASGELKYGIDDVSDDKIIYLYEIHSGLFINAAGHNGTGIGLMDVGSPFAILGTNGDGFEIHTNFVNSGNMLQYNVGRHGNSIFMDRRSYNIADVIQTWSFYDANPSTGTPEGGNNYFYVAGKPARSESNGYNFDRSKPYYIVLRGYNGQTGDASNISDVIADRHTPFDVAPADESGNVPANAAKFIIVTRSMLREAFNEAAYYATSVNPVDATWLMKDEDFYRTNVGHQKTKTINNKQTVRAWHLHGDLDALDNDNEGAFWPQGGDGASDNQYIGDGGNDAGVDYDRYFVVRLPKDKTGSITQTITLPKQGWYQFSVKGIGLQKPQHSSDDLPDCLFARLATADNLVKPDTKNISTTYGITQLQNADFYDGDNTEAPGLKFHYDEKLDLPYYSDVEDIPYFHKVYEAEEYAEGKGVTKGNKDVYHNFTNQSNTYVRVAVNTTATIKVNVPVKGHYVISVNSSMSNDNNESDVTVAINNQVIDDDAFHSGQQHAFEAYLNAGDNTISFTPTTRTMDLDRIIIERGRVFFAGNTVPFDRYKPTIIDNGDGTYSLGETDEAAGTVGYKLHQSSLTVDRSTDANGNHPVHPMTVQMHNGTPVIASAGIGTYHSTKGQNAPTTADLKQYGDNEIEIPINITEAGTYALTVYGYNSSTNDDRSVWVGVSNPGGGVKHWYDYGSYNETALTMKFDHNLPNTLQAKTITTPLDPTQKWISLGSGDGWTPDIAYISLRKVDNLMSECKRPFLALGSKASKSFNINIPQGGSGDYRIALWYSANKPASVQISNGTTTRNFELDTSTYPNLAYDANNILSPFTFLHLDEGDNTITVTNTSDNTIAFDNITVNSGICAELELGRNFVQSDNEKHTEVTIYVPDDNTDVEFGVCKTQTELPVIVDHFRASYLGNNKGLVLDQSQTSWDYVSYPLTGANADDADKGQYQKLIKQNNFDATTNPNAMNNIPVYLKHTFNTTDNTHVVGDNTDNQGNWNTIVLPFNVDRQHLTDAFGSSVEVGELESSPTTTINFRIININADRYKSEFVIKAGRPYFIRVGKEANKINQSDIDNLITSAANEGEQKTNVFFPKFNANLTGNNADDADNRYYLIRANIGNVTRGTDDFITPPAAGEGGYDVSGHGDDDNDGIPNTISFVPVYTRQTLPNAVYTLSNGSFAFFLGNQHHINGFRAYIRDNADGYRPDQVPTTVESGAKPWYFEDQTTGIVEIVSTIDETDTKHLSPTDNKVYNLIGQQVNANQLHRGIYILNGKKFIVK